MKSIKSLLVLLLAGSVTASAQTTEKPYTAYLVSDAHLDTQWNWDVQTTIRECVWNTLSQNLFLMKKYPEYVFNFEGGVKYWWMREYYPAQYEQLKHYIKSGQWHIAGSSWDACETVVVSPESWIRNILLGQTFYRQEFGTEGDDVFLPDCFGFGYDLPTLAAHCGLIGFSSQKLMWRHVPFYPDKKKYPFSVGLWKGIDGSQIMMVHGFNYAQRWEEGEDLSRSEEIIREAKESPLNMVYRYYGTGDMGGSPDLKSVQAVLRGVKGDGPVQVKSVASDQIYHDFLPYENHPELPVFDGELTMDLHGNASYTSQAAMKLYNRQNEHLGDATERAAVMADWIGDFTYPIKDMTANWRRLIWHQFHDDVTGTCLPRAYTFSWNDELLTSKRFATTLTTSIGGMARHLNTQVSGQPIVVYNTESFPMQAVATVDIDNAQQGYQVFDAQGKRVASQVVTNTQGQSQLLFDASAPSVGMRVYTIKKGGKASPEQQSEKREIENSVYRITVNEEGDVSSLIDKRSGQELVAEGKALRLVVFDDCKSTSWPAWEIQKHTIDQEPKTIHNDVKVSLVENGSLRKTLLIEKKYGESQIKQYLHLYEGSQADRIDFQTVVDWNSLNALLKAEFPLSVSNEKASYDLGLGYIQRGNNVPSAFEVYSHEWTDLTNADNSYGVTLMTDCKYGWDKPADNVLRLSLLYSPKTGSGYAYQARQDLGHHEFTYSLVGHKGALDPVAAVQKSTMLNSPLRTFATEKHAGEQGQEFSFVTCDNPAVMIRALKRAEVDDAYIVRVYELTGKQHQTAHLTFAGNIASAVEADGTEKELGGATFSGKDLTVDIKPFSVKSYKIRLQKEESKAETAVTTQLALTYDRKCFSYNEMRGDADFAGGYSYAAELMPEEGITVDGIPFGFGPLDSYNGVTCRGQEIALPQGQKYSHLYLLAASDEEDRDATFTLGKSEQQAHIPYYTGFVGQWGHEGQTTGYLKEGEVAYVGTHRHSTDADEPYEFTYMFKIRLDVPKGATSVRLPNDEHIVVFAATVANDEQGVAPATALFRTNNLSDNPSAIQKSMGENVLKEAKIIARSGEIKHEERAELLIDGDDNTKWCDVTPAPNYVTLDLGSEQTVKGWKLLSAGAETSSYITRTCLLQGRNSENEEWRTLDMLDGNKANVVERQFSPESVRYVRLYVVGPTQQNGGNATRIYNFELYK